MDVCTGASVDKIGLTETKLGIIPGCACSVHSAGLMTTSAHRAGGTQRLSRLLGPAVAKDLIFTARILDAPAALNLGLINHIAKSSQSASDRATELAREIVPSGVFDLLFLSRSRRIGLAQHLWRYERPRRRSIPALNSISNQVSTSKELAMRRSSSLRIDSKASRRLQRRGNPSSRANECLLTLHRC